LPKNDIINFLNRISESEKLNLSLKSLSCIQKLYKSDIRSMINFMQSNQDIVKLHNKNNYEFNIIDCEVWKTLIEKIKQREKIENLNAFVYDISIKYNIDKKNIIKDFLNYIIRNHPDFISNKFLSFVENVMHSQIQNSNVHINYSLSRLSSFISE